MAFGSYKSLGEFAKQFQLRVENANFINVLPATVDERFSSDFSFTLRNIDVRASEAAIGEFMITPILKEVWRNYADYLLIWSHVSLIFEQEFAGFPDYLFTKKTELGLVQDKPYLMVVEAKKDDFDAGWAQCAAALFAAQQINQSENLVLYGIVSNGDGWQFGKFQAMSFVRDTRTFGISDLVELFGALHFVFESAKEQAINS